MICTLTTLISSIPSIILLPCNFLIPLTILGCFRTESPACRKNTIDINIKIVFLILYRLVCFFKICRIDLTFQCLCYREFFGYHYRKKNVKIGIHFLPGTLLHKHCQLAFETLITFILKKKLFNAIICIPNHILYGLISPKKRQFKICGSKPTILLYF